MPKFLPIRGQTGRAGLCGSAASRSGDDDGLRWQRLPPQRSPCCRLALAGRWPPCRRGDVTDRAPEVACDRSRREIRPDFDGRRQVEAGQAVARRVARHTRADALTVELRFFRSRAVVIPTGRTPRPGNKKSSRRDDHRFRRQIPSCIDGTTRPFNPWRRAWCRGARFFLRSGVFDGTIRRSRPPSCLGNRREGPNRKADVRLR